jgi:hypothetical protein
MLGLDESHFQEIIDGMSEEEKAEALRVHREREEEYKRFFEQNPNHPKNPANYPYDLADEYNEGPVLSSDSRYAALEAGETADLQRQPVPTSATLTHSEPPPIPVVTTQPSSSSSFSSTHVSSFSYPPPPAAATVAAQQPHHLPPPIHSIPQSLLPPPPHASTVNSQPQNTLSSQHSHISSQPPAPPLPSISHPPLPSSMGSSYIETSNTSTPGAVRSVTTTPAVNPYDNNISEKLKHAEEGR